MKFLLLLTLFSFNAFGNNDNGAEFSYDNNWYVVHTEDSKNQSHSHSFKSNNLERVPDSDCTLGPVVHKYDAQMSDDTFSRVFTCGKEDIQETFKCNFDHSWKDEDGVLDEYATTCSKKYGNYTLILKIRRYPNEKYFNKEKLKNAIEKTKVQ